MEEEKEGGGGDLEEGGGRDWMELSVIPTSSRVEADIKLRPSSLVLV